MNHIDVRRGDTLKGGAIGDTITNYYGDGGVIVNELFTLWIVQRDNGTTYPVFKYDPARVIWGS